MINFIKAHFHCHHCSSAADWHNKRKTYQDNPKVSPSNSGLVIKWHGVLTGGALSHGDHDKVKVKAKVKILYLKNI